MHSPWKSSGRTSRKKRRSVEEFATSTSKLPADEQVDGILAKLENLNPELEFHLEPAVQDGVVSGLTLNLQEAVRDISPIRAFSQLTRLTITGGPGWLDLSSVNVLPIEELNCPDGMVFRNAPVLQEMQTLKTINGEPAREYLEALIAGFVSEAEQTAAADR